jgi:hypothetical protein
MLMHLRLIVLWALISVGRSGVGSAQGLDLQREDALRGLRGHVASVTTYRIPTGARVLKGFERWYYWDSYSFDERGNVTRIAPGFSVDSITYSYDSAGRIIRSLWIHHPLIPGVDSSANMLCTYSHDAGGRILAKNYRSTLGDSGEARALYTYGITGRIDSIVYYRTGLPTQKQSYRYEADGTVMRQEHGLKSDGVELLERGYDSNGHVRWQRSGSIARFGDTAVRFLNELRFVNDTRGNPVIAIRNGWQGTRDTLRYSYRYDRFGNWIERREFMVKPGGAKRGRGARSQMVLTTVMTRKIKYYLPNR